MQNEPKKETFQDVEFRALDKIYTKLFKEKDYDNEASTAPSCDSEHGHHHHEPGVDDEIVQRQLEIQKKFAHQLQLSFLMPRKKTKYEEHQDKCHHEQESKKHYQQIYKKRRIIQNCMLKLQQRELDKAKR